VSGGVDGEDEEILGLERPKEPMTVNPTRDGVAQRGVELGKDGSLEEEILYVRRLALQDLGE
jgi:hypothetical protein